MVDLSIQLDRQEQATRALELALVHAPDSPDVLGVAVRIHTRVLPDLVLAQRLAEQRLQLDPDHPSAQADLAMLQLLMGQPQQALGSINALLDHAGLQPGAQLLRLHLLRMAAGISPDNVAAELLLCYRALPAGEQLSIAWPLLGGHVDATLGPERADLVFAVFEILQQPASAQGHARLASLLGQ